MKDNADRYVELIGYVDPMPVYGRVSQVIGLILEGHADISAIGEVCEIASIDREKRLLAEVVGFRENKVLLMPLGEWSGIGPGSSIVSKGVQSEAHVGKGLLGRILDGMGHPADGKGTIQTERSRSLYPPPPNPLDRQRISQPLDLGIRAINGLLTCGQGQRMGIFAGSGVGKSVLMGMMARYTSADVNVIALIGERGREVKEFIEKDLQEEGLARSVIIVATSDQPPLIRRRGAFLAMTIAEYFRDRNLQVLFMMDSLTRLAMAQREIGLAIGEPPTTKGYTPSVFALLPKFLERAGTSAGGGSITGLYTVLVEGDDMNDPIPDTARSILDGHIVLSRALAAQNQYPAIDLLNSISRVMIDVVDPGHWEASRRLAQMVATYRNAEDLIHIGAYKAGSSAEIDQSIAKWGLIQSYFRQKIHERVDFGASVEGLHQLIAA